MNNTNRFGNLIGQRPGGTGSTLVTPPSELLTGLTNWWTLNESSGDRVNSVSGGQAMVPTNTPGGAAGFGNMGTVTTFAAASSQYLSVATPPLFSAVPFSIAGWFKVASNPTSPNLFCLFAQGRSDEACEVALAFQNVFNILFLPTRIHNGGAGASAVTLALDTWCHLALTRDAGTRLTMYRNGASVSTSDSITYSFSGIDVATLGGPAGTVSASGGTMSYLNGSLVGWGTWDRALTAGEVFNLYNGGNGVQYPF